MRIQGSKELGAGKYNLTEATNAWKHGTKGKQGKIGNQILPYGSLRTET